MSTQTHPELQESAFDAYERYLVPRFFGPGAQFLTEIASLQPGDRVLDVACGTGSVARAAAPLVGPQGKVTGLDINEGMLQMAERISGENHLKIEWRLGNALALPFPDHSFERAFCQQGLQFIEDRQSALREIHRVLVPGGRLVYSFLRSLPYNPAYARLVEALERYGWMEAARLMGSPFPPMPGEELRAITTRAGFQNVRILIGIGPVRYPSAREFIRQEIAATRAVLPTNHVLHHPQAEVYEALVRDMEQMVEDYTDDEGLTFPTETYIVTARR